MLSRRFGRGLRVGPLLAMTLSMESSPPALADEVRLLAYGRHLSGECSACHRIDGVDNGIPSITGWPAKDFIETMTFYREGLRPHQVMKSVAESLDDPALAALAAYYGSLPRPEKKR